MGEWIETFKGAVLASEYDSESHMNSQIYVARFDQATWFLLSSIGITPRSMKRAGRRIAVVRQSYQFLKELKGGELVLVQSGFVAVGRKFFRFLHRMLDAETGQLVATSDSTAVEASLVTGKSAALPSAQRKLAEGRLVTANVAESSGLA
ncbi:MAG TPA: acyl-CoA thioesterase [Alphaproteobacteria bacterium]|nr:acyl-CoA thioesterase [Alphaproteobacteria bacterium]